MNDIKVKPASGKLGVMCVGLGAVTTTTIIGVLMSRKGLSKPVGSFACEGIMRVGKGKDKCYKEVKDIILLKQVIAALGAIPMDRSNLRQSMQVINRMSEEVKKGRNFLIFAEGTRSKLGNKLLEFKGGSFKSAQKARCPIVPCVLIDSFVPFDQKSVKPVTVKLYYLPPMYYDEYKDMKTSQIAEEVKRRIELKITEVTGE